MDKDLIAIRNNLRRFAAQRNWETFHSPKNLAMALTVESAELLEHFQWLTEGESDALSDEQRREVRRELADVLIYLVQIADRLNVDLADAVGDKMTTNAVKYPAVQDDMFDAYD